MLSTIGLALIIIGWIEQLYRTLIRRHLSFSPFFLTLYIVGAAILAYSDFTQINIVNGAINAVIVVIAFVILITLIVRRKKPETF